MAPPSAKLAEERARSKRLQHLNEDERGIYVAESAEPYDLRASHRALGEQSAGLALYFDTITHFAILMLCLLLVCGLYPLLDAHASAELASNYDVRQITANATLAAQPGYQPFTQACERQASNSAILKMSHGSRCNDKITASYYSCPTFCDFNVSANDLNTAVAGSSYCAAHLPCSLSSLNAAERATCCVETLQESLVKRAPVGVFALQLVAMFILLVWQANFHKQQLVTAQQVNARSVTVGDYAAVITGLGTNDFTREDLAQFMAHYGEVASVVYTKNIGTLLTAEHRLSHARLRLHELRAWRDGAAAGGEGGGGGVLGALYRRLYLGSSTSYSDHDVAREEAALDVRSAVIAQLAKRPVHNTGEAFVTFNYETHCNNCFDDHRRMLVERLGDLFKGKGPPRFNGKRIVVKPPPEASDVNWENYDVRGWERLKRNAVTVLGMCAALSVGVALQYFFERQRQDIRLRTYDKEVKAAVTGDDGPSSVRNEVTLTFLTALSSSVIVLINILLTNVAKALNQYQRFHTRTNYEASLMLKLTIVHVINSVIVPIATSTCDKAPSSQGECLWYAPGGLIEQAFYLQCFNAFLPDLIAVTNIGGRLKRRLFAPMVKTQEMLDVLMEPPEFILAESYAAVLKTIALAILYGPVLPISYGIALLGLTSTYWSDKFMALRRCQKPIRTRNKATTSVVNTINVLTIVQLFVSFFVFFNAEMPGYFIGSLIMWLSYNFFPVKRLLGIKRDEALEDGGTGDVSYLANMGWSVAARDAGDAPTSPHLPQLGTLSLSESNGAASLSDAEKERAKAIHCKLLRIRPEDYSRGRLKMYYPPIPAAASDDSVANVVTEYRLFEKAVLGNPTLLPGQKSQTGGSARVCPPNGRAVASMNAMHALNLQHSGGMASGASMPPPMQMAQQQQSHPYLGQQQQMSQPYPGPQQHSQQQFIQYPAQQQQQLGYGAPQPQQQQQQQYGGYTPPAQQYAAAGYGAPPPAGGGQGQGQGHDDGWGHSRPPLPPPPPQSGPYDAYNQAGYQ